MLHALRKVLILFTFFFLGCNDPKASVGHTDYFPTGIALESGDIILARSGGFLPAAAASLGEPETSFGHGAVYFKEKTGFGKILHMQPNGLATFTPEQYWEKYFLTGVVRLNSGNNLDQQEFDRQAQKLMAYNKKNRILADFWGESANGNGYTDNGVYPESLYCLTLINMLYEKSGHPRPFEKYFNIADTPMLQLVGKIIDESDFNVIVVASIFANDNFTLIAEHISSELEEKRAKIDDAMLQVVNRYLASGCEIKNPPPSILPITYFAYGMKVITTPFLPAGLKNMLREVTSVREINMLYSMNKFIKNVRDETLEVLESNPKAEITATTFKVADKYKCKYFQAEK